MNRLADEILDTLPALLFQINDSAQVTGFRASRLIQGHPQPPRLPCTLFDLWPKSTAAEIARAITRLEAGQPPLQFSYNINGGEQPHHFKARISKQAEGFTLVAMDASAELDQEAERHRLYEQLRQNQKMEALGQLTGGIAHDFNNILASILGYADLTLDAVESLGKQDLVRYLREVIDSGERARDLIAQMLAFARAKPNDAIALMAAPLVKEAVKMLHAGLPSTIALSVSSEEELPLIKIDPAQLNQVIVNLCINARDAIGEKGHIDITITRSNAPQHCSSCQERFEGEYVEIAVADDGNGIDPAIIGRIFDPFFTTREPGRNSGMGLAMVHSIVHEHGGHIVIDSQPGYGATVRLYFPATRRDQVRNTTRSLLPRETPLQATILVIDDEESIARLQGELLRAKGFSAVVFSDPIHALEAYKVNPNRFDLVLVDQTMPGMTGIEVAQAILQLRPNTPIILNTAQGDRDYSEAARSAGIRVFLTKPFPSEQLLGAIYELLQPQTASS